MKALTPTEIERAIRHVMPEGEIYAVQAFWIPPDTLDVNVWNGDQQWFKGIVNRKDWADPKPCPAVLNIAGKHFDCDWPTDSEGKHDGWGHTNKEAQAIWIDDRNELRPSWRSA